MTDAQIIEGRRLRMGGMKWAAIARKNDVSVSSMRNAILGYTYWWVEELLEEIKEFEQDE
jgi:lambda repressor-like predicted transcriptional regulator